MKKWEKCFVLARSADLVEKLQSKNFFLNVFILVVDPFSRESKRVFCPLQAKLRDETFSVCSSVSNVAVRIHSTCHDYISHSIAGVSPYERFRYLSIIHPESVEP